MGATRSAACRTTGGRSRARRRPSCPASPSTTDRPCGRGSSCRTRAADGCDQLDLVGVDDVETGVVCRSGAMGWRSRSAAASASAASCRPYSDSMAAILEPVTVLRHERPPARPSADRGGRRRRRRRSSRNVRRPRGREAGPRGHPDREERLLRRLHRPQRWRRLDARQLRPRAGRPGRRPRAVEALPGLDRRRRGAQDPPRHLRRPRRRGPRLRPGPHPAALHLGAAVLRLPPRGARRPRRRPLLRADPDGRAVPRRRAGPAAPAVHQGAGQPDRHAGRLPQDQPRACAAGAGRPRWSGSW